MKGFGNNKKANSSNISLNGKTSSDNEVLYKTALSLHSKGKLKEAASYYLDLLRKGRKDPVILNNLGVIYQQFKQNQKAINLYRQSILSFPKNPEAYSNLARILIDNGNYEEAKHI